MCAVHPGAADGRVEPPPLVERLVLRRAGVDVPEDVPEQRRARAEPGGDEDGGGLRRRRTGLAEKPVRAGAEQRLGKGRRPEPAFTERAGQNVPSIVRETRPTKRVEVLLAQ